MLVNTKNKLIIALITLLSVLSIVGLKSVHAGPARQSLDIKSVKIDFDTPIDLDVFIELQKNHKFKQQILEGEFTYDGTPIHDFYIINESNKIQDIKSEYIKSRKGLITDTNKNNPSSKNGEIPTFDNITLTNVTLIGEGKSVEAIKKDISNKNIKVKNLNEKDLGEIKPKDKVAPKKVPTPDESQMESVTSAAVVPSIPMSGTSYFYTSSAGGRYVQQNMTWPSVSFGADQTYEHDVFLYNYDRKTYLNGASIAYPGCFPTTTYAATSWPSESKPYLDTRFSDSLSFCEIDELSYTIGAAQANAIKANTNYYTYIRTAIGNDTADKFKVQAQIGHRTPSGCYTTWCSFGDASYNLVPAWSTVVPGTLSWQYGQSIPNAPSNVSITDPTANSLRVNFTDNASNETNIYVERKTGTGGTWVSLASFGTLTGTGNWYWINSSLASNTTYCYRLKATNSSGSSPYSNEACGTTTGSSTRSEVITDDKSSYFTKGGSYWWEASIGYNSHMFWTYVNGSSVSSWGENFN
ncbi:MAG: hypothetical protein UU72_C0052G0004 [candidate division WWE3 bacterium GW2011_GWB1_41_6]|uniref:Fibronectin type-III domain-containing protein n=1 Tax=candidate division WWE3 bacterium GW2011_GWB1_41_6 TaxID=1619112 RepID=A0A0G0WQ41_UNCKA|nr:MAG: hypothetical protein UU72_C0052G0004 [candidate division WWE3 bacterium GW2011_GWB1_41_6]